MISTNKYIRTFFSNRNQSIRPFVVCGLKSCLQNKSLPFCGKISTSTSNHIWKEEENNDKLVQYGIKEEKSSKAMRAYLERSELYNQFIAQEQEEFKTGKRHLANMMGKDPENFTQNDVNEAIEYLFPSGLFVKKARPIMKPPEDVHPAKKEAEFDKTGRPYHYLFYTSKPNFYEYLHKLVDTVKELNAFEDSMTRKRLTPDPALAMTLEGHQWLSKEQFEGKFIEELSIPEHRQLVATLERIVLHPYSYRVKDLIMDARAILTQQTNEVTIPKPQLQADGREYATYLDAKRKSARANVTVRSPGTGLVNINGFDLSYFPDFQSREQLLFPLQLTGMLNKVDVEATVRGGGWSTQAGAVRIGLSFALRSFLSTQMVEQMRLAGLLTYDYRIRERKKPGQAKARKKFTWKKR